MASLKSYQVKQLELDYAAGCRVRVKTPSFDENGSCRIQIDRNSHFQIQVHSPLGGLLFAVYQDDHQIQVINYHEKTAMQLENNERNRSRAFEIVNLSGAEFRSIFWGREIDGESGNLVFKYRNDRPFQIRKSLQGADQLVTVTRWLSYAGVWFPKTVVFEDASRDIYLKVVITSFNPGVSIKPVPDEIPVEFHLIR